MAVIIFVSLIIAAALHGPVSWLEKLKVPRVLGAFLIYALMFFIVSLIVYLIFPPLATEIGNLANSFPAYIEKIGGGMQYWIDKYQLQDQTRDLLVEAGQRIEGYATGLIATIISIFGGLISALAILVISFYLTLNARESKKYLVSLVPAKRKEYIDSLIDRLQIKMGSWLRGQLLLMLIVGILVFIGLYFLGVKYALILALIAGLFEIVPWIGPLASGALAAILAFFQSPLLALLVVILFLAVQQLENNLIVPQVMKRTVGLNPVVVIVALLVGGKLAGILGAVIAVPAAAVIGEIIKGYQQRISKTK